MIKLDRIKKKLGRKTVAMGLAVTLGITTLLPSILNAQNLIPLLSTAKVAPTWTAETEAQGNEKYDKILHDSGSGLNHSATGLAFNVVYFNGNNEYPTRGWPLGGLRYLEPVDGKDNSEYKDFEMRHTYCVANHVPLNIEEGTRAFCSGVYTVNSKPDWAMLGNPTFNFLMIALACNYADSVSNGVIPRNTWGAFNDPAVGDAVVCQMISWIATYDGGGFVGDWETDLNQFRNFANYYNTLLTVFNEKDPYISNYLAAPPDADSGAAISGLTTKIDAIFYDVWMAANLTSQLTADWAQGLTFISSKITQENGQYKATVTMTGVPESASVYMTQIPFQGYGDWKLQMAKVSNPSLAPDYTGPKTGNNVEWTLTSATGATDENGCIGSLDYDNTDIRGLMPVDMTKAKLYTFDTKNYNAADPAFGQTQTQFGSVIEKGLKLYVKYGESPTPDENVSVHRYEHTENWKANYNVNLYKLDSETGKPISGSHWDILEKFDDSQLDNTDLDRTPDNPGSFDVETGSLVATEWGDDSVEDNYSGNMGVLDADANKYNWKNDGGTQFERWDDPESDPCTRDDNKTGADGKLYEVDSAGNVTSDVAHTDVKNYTYHKGYCGGHPAPEIEYEELTGDEEEDAQIEEDNQALHDEAWAKWYAEVATCEQLVKEGGFFHSINPGEAKTAMEADRDEFYKQFISLTYEYSAREIEAAPGYIIHGTHTDDIPIEWRVVTSSE